MNITFVPTIVKYFIVVGIAYFTLSLANNAIRMHGIDMCMRGASFQKVLPAENVTLITPHGDWYNRCMIEKGLK